MPLRKIRHATVQYFVPSNTDRQDYKTVFRNQVVDIPQDQVERLDSLGATVAPDADLDRPGRMAPLPETASDAELLNWVMGATPDEVATLVMDRPVLASRIEAAKAAVDQRFEEQSRHLGGLQEVAAQATDEEAEERLRLEAEERLRLEAEAAAAAGTPAPTVGSPSTPAPEGSEVTPPPGAPAPAPTVGSPPTAPATTDGDDLIGGTTPALTAEEADAVVARKATEVVDYISANPTTASLILEAEGRRAEATKEPVRVSVARAVEAAAGFTQ